jgi:hypothetical protein
MKKILLPAFFLLLSALCYSQKGYVDGYIITTAGDTVHGKIKDTHSGFQSASRSNHILFKAGDNKETKYKPSDIASYSKLGMVEYISIKMNLSSEFAEVIEKGDATLVRIESKSTTPSMNANGDLTTSYDISSETYYIVRNRLDPFLVTTINFKNGMKKCFGDYPELMTLIDNKSLKYNDLKLIVKKYNEWKRAN